MTDIELECHCGNLQGMATKVTPKLGNRLACCCQDCQAFAHFLGNEHLVLDEYGATDIVQLPVSHIIINQGAEHLACVRLSEKGLFRWYADCCKCPIGNTLGAASPFIGLIHCFIPNLQMREQDLGKSRGYIQLKGARKQVPIELKGDVLILVRSLIKLLIWKIQGFNQPSAFFEEHGKPRVTPNVLTRTPEA